MKNGNYRQSPKGEWFSMIENNYFIIKMEMNNQYFDGYSKKLQLYLVFEMHINNSQFIKICHSKFSKWMSQDIFQDLSIEEGWDLKVYKGKKG